MKIALEFDDHDEMMEFVKRLAPLIEMDKPREESIVEREGTMVLGSTLPLVIQKKLYDAGFKFIEDVLATSDDDLLFQHSIDGDTIRELREWKAPEDSA